MSPDEVLLSMVPSGGEWDERLGRVRCCDQDFGGSHYHCGNCSAVTGMYGHYITLRLGVKWAEDRAKTLGVVLPWQGFSCAVE